MELRAFDGRIIFDHLPKTAGHAVNQWLRQELGFGAVSPLSTGNHTDLIRRLGGSHSVIFAHVTFDGRGLDPRYRYITCLREPVDRAISWLYYALHNFTRPQLPTGLWDEVERCVRSEGAELGEQVRAILTNPYVEHFAAIARAGPRGSDDKLQEALGAISDYEVCGLYEHMPAFLNRVAGILQIPAARLLDRVNVTRRRPRVAEISRKFRRRLAELNSLDLEFYDEIVARRQGIAPSEVTLLAPTRSAWAVMPDPGPRAFETPDLTLLSVSAPGLEGTVTKGDRVTLEIEFSLNRPVPHLVAGIHIFDQGGRCAFGTNTDLLGRQPTEREPGRYRASYEILADLPAGEYRLGIAFLDRLPDRQPEIAWFDDLLAFTVQDPAIGNHCGYGALPFVYACARVAAEILPPLGDGRGRLLIQPITKQIEPGETFELQARLENKAAEAWVSTERHPIHLSYHWLDPAGRPVVFEGLRTALPVSRLMPGNGVDVALRIKAPEQVGRFRLIALPLQEHRCWFDSIGFSPAEVSCEVKPQRGMRRALPDDMLQRIDELLEVSFGPS
jgi:hypothetical protein